MPISLRYGKADLTSLQIRELVDYLALSQPEDQRPAFVQPFADVLEIADGQPPIEEDEPRRTKVLTMVLGEVKGLGDGSEKGASVIITCSLCTDLTSLRRQKLRASSISSFRISSHCCLSVNLRRRLILLLFSRRSLPPPTTLPSSTACVYPFRGTFQV